MWERSVVHSDEKELKCQHLSAAAAGRRSFNDVGDAARDGRIP